MSDARPTTDAQGAVPGATAGPGTPDSPAPVSVDVRGAERRTGAREKCKDCGTTPAERGSAAGAEWIRRARENIGAPKGPPAEPMLATREALARALYQTDLLHGGVSPDWTAAKYVAKADALLASGVVQSPAEYVRGLADDEAHCPTCTCGCTCGYGGEHDDRNPRCEKNAAALPTGRSDR